MGNCKTCKFWGKYREGVCDLIEMTDDSDEYPQTGLAVVLVTAADDHGLRGELRTGPDFGCVHHLPISADKPSPA